MADDWVSKYFGTRKREEDKEAADARRMDLAKAASPTLFRDLALRVQRDVDSFQKERSDTGIKFEYMTPHAFLVRQQKYPAVTLEVTLSLLCVHYAYTFQADHASDSETKEGDLLMSADLQGRVQLKKNGKPFTDHSETSEFLLTPLFDYATS